MIASPINFSTYKVERVLELGYATGPVLSENRTEPAIETGPVPGSKNLVLNSPIHRGSTIRTCFMKLEEDDFPFLNELNFSIALYFYLFCIDILL